MFDLKQELFAPKNSICDTHAHYDDTMFDDCREYLLSALSQNGVGCIINNATDLEGSAEKCLEMSKKIPFC